MESSLVFKNVVYGDQHGMGDCKRGSIFATSSRNSLVLCKEIRTLYGFCRLCTLRQNRFEWLIKKNYFKTILVGNTMRVMIDSFEEWYANQFKYQKVDGTPPGEELKKTTYSMEELGQRLGLKEATAYELVAKWKLDCDPHRAD